MPNTNRKSGINHVGFDLDPKELDAVKELAKADDRSVSNYMRIMVRDHIKEKAQATK